MAPQEFVPRKRYTEEQIGFALRQAEAGTSPAEICRKLGVTEQTLYRWKKRFGELASSTRASLVDRQVI